MARDSLSFMKIKGSTHANAHGASIHESQLSSFLNYANTTLSKDAFVNTYYVDYIFECGDLLFPRVGMQIAEHPEYFGNGIEEVKVVVKNIPLSNILVMGADKTSIKISSNGVDFVKFKDESFIEEVMENRDKALTVYGRLNLNEWQGKKSLQVFISDYEFSAVNKYDF